MNYFKYNINDFCNFEVHFIIRQHLFSSPHLEGRQLRYRPPEPEAQAASSLLATGVKVLPLLVED